MQNTKESIFYSLAAKANASKNFDWAIKYFTEAIRLKPKYAEVFNNRGFAYRQKGEKTKAEADFAEAKRLGFVGKEKPK